jgi:hypothetical protein
MRTLLLVFMVVVLSACQGGKDFRYQPADEIPDGPGLFSGKDGKWTVFIPYD